MSWKAERIERYGKVAYEKKLEQMRRWGEANPEKVKAHSHDQNRKGGRNYLERLNYRTTGIPGARNRIRSKHAREWRDYKKIIAPDSQVHHEWIPKTSEYNGVALVETDKHMHGIIKVIIILKGKITLFTEKEIREQNKNNQPFGQPNQSLSPASGSSG